MCVDFVEQMYTCMVVHRIQACRKQIYTGKAIKTKLKKQKFETVRIQYCLSAHPFKPLYYAVLLGKLYFIYHKLYWLIIHIRAHNEEKLVRTEWNN